MVCKEANELITARVDNELSDLERSQIDEHLESCSQCLFIYRQELELKKQLHAMGARVVAPDGLRQRILADPRIFPPTVDSSQRWWSLLAPVRIFTRPAFALALLVVLLLPTFYLMWPADGSISLAALEAHAEINDGHMPITENVSEKELVAHLIGSVGGRFAPMGYDLSAAGLTPVGGTATRVDKRDVLIAVYRGQAPAVSCFTFIGTEADAPPKASVFVDPESQMRYFTFTDGTMNGVMHRVSGRVCLLVSKMPLDELLTLVRSVEHPVKS